LTRKTPDERSAEKERFYYLVARLIFTGLNLSGLAALILLENDLAREVQKGRYLRPGLFGANWALTVGLFLTLWWNPGYAK
jgi:hypothetical protein